MEPMIRNHWILPACLAAAGILLYLAVFRSPAPTAPGGASPNCDIQHGPCTQPLADGSATLEILPRPVRAMTDLTFRLTLAPAPGAEEGLPFIDLDMPAMFMGYNRVHMVRESPGIYSGAGVIVRCPTGIPTWEARVFVPGRGEAGFVFDVRY